MSNALHDTLELLRYELNFIEQGGYRRLRSEGLSPSPFQDSLSCLNHGDPMRPHACHECKLYQFVPESARSEDVPCHFIKLDRQGNTIQSVQRKLGPEEVEQLLKTWLEQMLALLEREIEVTC